jgi:DNA replication protein DnaC
MLTCACAKLTSTKAITKFSSYVERMSLVFMEIGRSSPRNQELALLYQRSEKLQAHINEYFIITVCFCHDMLRFARKSSFRQFTTTLGSDVIKTAQDELRSWSAEITAELTVLMAQKIEQEALENSKMRLVSKKFWQSTSAQQTLSVKLRVLDGCSSYDHRTAWKQIRKIGNTTAFAQTEDYKKWKEACDSSTLLFIGKLGCGKSVMMANMVDDINLSYEQNDKLVVYFFVQHDVHESLKARIIIGSLARQLLAYKDSLPDKREPGQHALDIQDMIFLLENSYGKARQIYLVLDGLDLCEKQERKEVINFVRKLQRNLWLHACVSLRQEPVYEPDPVYRRLSSITSCSFPDNGGDIAIFIDSELQRCLEDGSLTLGDPSLILYIEDALHKGSSGMFLWVALQIKTLCSLETDEEIVEALKDLPVDLSRTYDRIMQRAHGGTRSYQDRILQLIISARRPLKVEEMREALSVEVGCTEYKTTKLLNDVYATLRTCGCLVQVDEEDVTVRFVHPSVQEFVLRAPLHPAAVHAPEASEVITISKCHQTMADIIVTYLSWGCFDTQISTRRIPRMDAGDTPSRVLSSLSATSKHTRSLALKLLAQKKQLNFDISEVLAKQLATQSLNHLQEFFFLEYARRWCLEHICKVRQASPGTHVKALLPSLLERNPNDNCPGPGPSAAFMMAVENDNAGTLKFLLGSSMRSFAYYDFDYTYQERTLRYTPFSLATCQGRQQLVNILQDETLHKHAEVRDFPPATLAPCYVAYAGRGSPNAFTGNPWIHVCQSGRNLLSVAIWGNNMDMLRFLLPRVNPNSGSPDHFPVKEALIMKNIDALQILHDSKRVFITLQDRWEFEIKGLVRELPEARPILEDFPMLTSMFE